MNWYIGRLIGLSRLETFFSEEFLAKEKYESIYTVVYGPFGTEAEAHYYADRGELFTKKSVSKLW